MRDSGFLTILQAAVVVLAAMPVAAHAQDATMATIANGLDAAEC